MASYYTPRYTRSLLAAVDLSAKKFHYVGENGSGKYNIAGGAAGAIGAGFLMNEPEINEACEVASIGGGAKGVAAETISGAEIELRANASGQMEVADTAGDIVCAISKESAATNDIFELEPVLYRKHA